MEKSSDAISDMFNSISAVYDRVNRMLSFGIDQIWRKKLLNHLPEKEDLHLLDLATGTCDQLLILLKSQKITRAVGIDFAEKMIKVGKRKLKKYPQVDLKVGSALDIAEENESFDCVSISFGIRNVGDEKRCLEEMYRVLKKRARALILEFSLPSNRIMRALHLFYLRRVVPFVGGLVSKKKQAYVYLNQSIEEFSDSETFCALMDEVGFAKVDAYPLTFGMATLYVGEKS